MYIENYEICSEYEKYNRYDLINKCLLLAKETELFCSILEYIDSLEKKNKKKLAMELRSLELRKDFMIKSNLLKISK